MHTKHLKLASLFIVIFLLTSCHPDKRNETTPAVVPVKDSFEYFLDSCKQAEANDDDPTNDGYDSLRRMGITYIIDSNGSRSIINSGRITAVDTIKVKKY
jgi:hypothetical protein